jgi:FtsH-binding integral membrane protein
LGAVTGSADPYAAAPSYSSPNYPGGGVLPAEPVRPRTVDLAFWCWILTTVISLIGLVLTLNSSVWDAAIAAGVRSSGETRVDVQSLVTVAKAILIVVFLISVGIYLLFAFKMRAGRNWARITLTVFGAFTIISSLTPATGSVTVNSETFSAGSRGPGWITAVVVLAAIILMFVGESNRYFADSKAYRQRRSG